ncbi:MAG: glycosyltransferase family 39 protein [Desulfobacterales bacterium]|nr:glycosyltransferase family 39 protein [Desulfobacterales bacterium]
MNQDSSQDSWVGCSRSEFLLLAVVMALAMLLRQMIHVRLFPDSVDYLTIARNILSGIHHNGDISLIRYRRAPLYPHLVALLSLGETAPAYLAEVGRQVSILAGTLFLFPLYFLARRLTGKYGALTALFLASIIPEFVYYSGTILTESLAALLVGCGMALLWVLTSRPEEQGSGPPGKGYQYGLPALLGVLLGLAFVARFAAIGFLGLGLVWFSVTRTVDGGGFRGWLKRVAIPLVLIIAGFFTAISPHLLYLHNETGRWTLAVDPASVNIENLAKAGAETRYSREYESRDALAPDAEHFIWEQEPGQGVFSMMRSHPGPYARAYFNTLFQGYLADTAELPYPVPVLILVLLGLVAWILRRKYREILFCLWGFGGYYLFLALFLNLRDRYMFSAYLFLLLAAAAGGAVLIDLAVGSPHGERPRGKKRRIRAILLYGILCLTMLPGTLSFIRTQNSWDNRYLFEELGARIGQDIEANALVFDRTSHVPFYAGAVTATLPAGRIEDIIHFARVRGIKYWIASSRYIPALRPGLAPLLDFKDPPAGLELVNAYVDKYRQLTVVYHILPK